MRTLFLAFFALLLAAPSAYGRTKVLILPPAWESGSLKSFAREMDNSCEDLIPAIKNADGYCATSALSAEVRDELAKCNGRYSCLKKQAGIIDDYDILALSSLSKKGKTPQLKVALYDTQGNLLYSEKLKGERGSDPEETASLYLTALRNAKDVFSKPANKQETKEALRRGFALYKKGDIGNALRFFEKAGADSFLRLASDTTELIERATVELKNGDLHDAIGDLQRAIEKDEELRLSGYKLISYIKETEKTKRSEFDNNDFYDDLLKIHDEFERRYGALDKKRKEEERKIAEREQETVRGIEREVAQARKEIDKQEEKIAKERSTVDGEVKRLLEKQEKELQILSNKKDLLRQRIESLRNGRNEFADKVERRADELKNKDLEKLQTRFLKDQEAIEKKIAALESKDPPDEKGVTALEDKLKGLEDQLDKKRIALNEEYRKAADAHLAKYDRKVEETQNKLALFEKEETAMAKETQKNIDRKEAVFKERFRKWQIERKKKESLIAKMIKLSEKRIANAGKESQTQRDKLAKRLNGEKEKILIAEKEKISKRYTARFVPEFKRVIERTAATKKIYALLGTAYARLGENSRAGDDLPEARRHFHRALYYDPANKAAMKGVDLIRKRAVVVYETAIAMSDDDRDQARKALETIINCLKPTNPVYVRSFIALKELSDK